MSSKPPYNHDNCLDDGVPGKQNEKRKARPSFPDQPGKRVNAGTSSEPHGDIDASGAQDPELQSNAGTVTKSGSGDFSHWHLSQGTPLTGLRNRKVRTAPTRPPGDSDSDSVLDDQGEGGQEIEPESAENGVSERSLSCDGILTILTDVATSPTPSEDETGEPVVLSATQFATEVSRSH